MLQIKTIKASDIKIGDRIITPNVIKPYLTEDGLLPNELAEAFEPVLKVGVFKDIDIKKRTEILKHFCFSLDTIIIMVRVSGDLPKDLKLFAPNGTMNTFHSPQDDIMILSQEDTESDVWNAPNAYSRFNDWEDESEDDIGDDPNTYARCSDWEDEPENCYHCADDDCPMNKG